MRLLTPISAEVHHRFHFVGLLSVARQQESTIPVASTFPRKVYMCSSKQADLSMMESLFHTRSKI